MSGNSIETHLPRILVVDDDPAMRKLVQGALKRVECDLHVAEDGEDALAQFGIVRPDLVILDVDLPGADGFDICAQLRRDPVGENVPILMLTGANDRESIKKAYDVGATDYFAKSTNLALLPHRVRYILRSSQTYSDLKESQERLSKAQRIAHLGNWHLSLETGELQWSTEVYRIFGKVPSEAVLTYDYFFSQVHPDDQELVRDAVGYALENSTAFRIEHRVLRSDGSVGIVQQIGEVLVGEDGSAIGMDGTIQDVTEQKAAEERIRNLAYFDPLTGLGNRQQFTERLNATLADARRRRTRVAVVFLDLDQFKQVNDSLGHAAGDDLLKQVADRLRSSIRESDMLARNEATQLARLGGDEFTLILTDLDRATDAAIIAERVCKALAEPFEISGQKVYVSSSIGIAVYPGDGSDADALVTHADVAMYQSKTNGGNQYTFYAASMSRELHERLDLKTRLRDAIENDYLSLRYQPIVRLLSGELVGVEALVRWYDAELGAIAPDRFIPVAEESGLIEAVGEWVLREGCRKLAEWEARFDVQIRLSFNISAFHFGRGKLGALLDQVVEATGVSPEHVQLELSESLIMRTLEEAIAELQALKDKGVTLAVDDFGTGHTSLRGLARLPLDSLKIDRTFIQELGSSPLADTLVGTIAAMGKALGLELIAEGLETSEQLAFVRDHACDLGQGYVIARPMTANNIEALIEAGWVDLARERD